MRTWISIICAGVLALAGALSASAQSIYDFTVKAQDGSTIPLSEYKGKVLLIVNTATECGFTPQYKELEALYRKFQADAAPLFTWLKSRQGFKGFGNGPKAQAMDGMLAKKDPDYKNNPDIKWNFTKFLVDREGNVTTRFEPTQSMKFVESVVGSKLF